MDSKKAKSLAKETLKDNWGKFAGATLLYLLVTLLLSYVPYVGSFINLFLTPVLAFGFTKMFVDFKNGEEVGSFDFFTTGFKFFGKVWGVTLRVALKMLPPIVLAIIAVGLIAFSASSSLIGGADISLETVGISFIIAIALIVGSSIWTVILFYKYMYATMELAYDPEGSTKEIVNKSGEFMNGNKAKAFYLSLSFIGWLFLSALLLGIPYFWVLPYMMMSKVCFYAGISGKLNKPEVIEQIETETPVIEN